jgi:hypothetical protein
MKCTRILLAACVSIAACLPQALGQGSASGPEVKLTCFDQNETISKHASYPITWTAENIGPNTMLSFQLSWTTQDSGVRLGGIPQRAEESRLISSVLDSTDQKRLAALGPVSNRDFPTIESGKYLWDVDKFCKDDRENNKSVCDAAVSYRLHIILRSADDPCGDNLHCRKPRSLFKVYVSDAEFSFRD